MKNYIPNAREISILESFSRACKIVPILFEFDVYDFFQKALTTKTFDRYFDDMTVYTQADTYIIDTIVEELKEKGVTIQPKKYNMKDLGIFSDASYWAGYLFLSWRREEGIPGIEIVTNYDIQRIINAYPTLHTTSIEYAIDEIKEEMKLENRENLYEKARNR